MRWKPEPALVTLEGERFDAYEYAELLGIDEDDAELLGECGPALTGEDIAYLNAKYPEYMGIWPIIAKAGALIAKGGAAIGKGIAGAVKRRREAKKEKAAGTSAQKLQAQIMAQQQAAIMQQQTAAAAQKKKLLMIGLPLAAVALFAIMSMNKAPAPAAPEKGGKK